MASGDLLLELDNGVLQSQVEMAQAAVTEAQTALAKLRAGPTSAEIAAAEAALEYVRGGNGPLLMELKTYRYRGHSMSDPAKYRSREEVQDMRDHHDPIEAAKAELIKRGVSEDKIKDIDKQIRSRVSQSADFAENSPEPDLAELYTDVLVERY